MSEQGKEPSERNNPSQATPQPHPDFVLRHDQAVLKPAKEDVQNKGQEEHPKKSGA
jgi:hypothetical protein